MKSIRMEPPKEELLLGTGDGSERVDLGGIRRKN